ncbi:dynein regulatory complex subunit 2 [Gadus morhua]|uniref:Dynein regulatory complex protein 1 n=1 Tax=Gadus morhua TaxID=8049 RepID=A0A8C4Z6D9_GADMO|nr:dynein regulatory complex subunit 2 [Gadus morhua]
MPKKGSKKDGGGKGSGMTDEERVVFLQQRAEAEKDNAKRKEEMLTQFLEDKLQKEEKNTAVNLHKLTQQWRVVLRRARGAELSREVDIVSQTFERVLDRRDSVVKCLVGDLSEAEQQFGLALRSQLHYVDRLLALQTGRLAFFQQRWDGDLQELGTEFSAERELIYALHRRDCTYLEDVSAAMELHRSEADDLGRLDYQSTRDEIKTKYISEKHALVVQMDQVMRQVRQGMGVTEDQRTALNNLLLSDQRRAQEIDVQMKRLQKMQESIAALRRPDPGQKEREAVARDLRATKEAVTQQTRELKARLGHARLLDRKRLTALSVQSSAAAKQLQGLITKGGRSLRRAEMCRRFESEHEKVLPFYASSLTPEEQSREEQRAMEPPSEELARALMDYSDLARFWQRYNKVLLERLVLEKEKEVLTQENRQLQGLLRQYMDGISVSDETLRRQNPLLMVSRPTLAPPPGTERRPPRHTVVEAVRVIQNAR